MVLLSKGSESREGGYSGRIRLLASDAGERAGSSELWCWWLGAQDVIEVRQVAETLVG